MNGIEVARIDDDAALRLGLSILRVPSTFHHNLERALIRVLHDLDDILNGSGPEYRCGDAMEKVALINRDRLSGCFIEKQRASQATGRSPLS